MIKYKLNLVPVSNYHPQANLVLKAMLTAYVTPDFVIFRREIQLNNLEDELNDHTPSFNNRDRTL